MHVVVVWLHHIKHPHINTLDTNTHHQQHHYHHTCFEEQYSNTAIEQLQLKILAYASLHTSVLICTQFPQHKHTHSPL